MELYRLLVTLVERMNWQIDEVSTKIGNISSRICSLVDGIELTEITENSLIAIRENIVLLKQVISYILRGDRFKTDNFNNVKSACRSFLHYSTQSNEIEGNISLPALYGTAYSSLNLYYSYCSSLNPIKTGQPVLFFFQSCPADQNHFDCEDECNGAVDYCSKTGTYPVIVYATNPIVFKRTLSYYSANPYHILHFSTHGTNDELLFCTPGTYKTHLIQPDFVLTSLLQAKILHNKLPLVYANACYSDSFVRHFLIRKRNYPVIRRVIGVAGENTDLYANEFSSLFYNDLALIDSELMNLEDLPLCISNSFYRIKASFRDMTYRRKILLMKRRKNR